MINKKLVFRFLFFFSISLRKICALHITQPVVFDVQDFAQIAQNTPFASIVNIDVNNNMVTITIPSLTFSLPSEHSVIIPPQLFGPVPPKNFAGGGYVYLKSGFIPKPYRPTAAIGVQTNVTSTPSAPFPGMIAVVTLDGNIRIAAPPTSGIFPGGTVGFNGPGYYPIQMSGSFTTNPITISYPLAATPINPPVNFALSQGHTQEIYLPFSALVGQYADTYFGDIYNGFFGSYWADNSTVTQYPFNANALARMGIVTQQNGQAVVQLQDPVVVIPSQPGFNFAQGGIAINPSNSNNVVLSAILGSDQLSATDPFQLWRAVSKDGGKTWPSNLIGRIDGQGGIAANAGADNNSMFDRFGNYWVTNITVGPSGFNLPYTLSILVSFDGGQTFEVAAHLNPTNYGASNQSFLDFNQMAFGGDGNGGWALYFTCALIDNLAGTVTPYIGYIPVTGKGVIGSPSLQSISLGATPDALQGFCGGATPIVSDEGAIFINYYGQTQNNLGTYAAFYLFNIPGGINGIASGALNGPHFLAQTNVAFAIESAPGVGTWYRSFNAKNIRGANPGEAVRGLAYDNNKKVLYALFNDTDPVYSQNGSLYLLVSKDAGVTWSAPYFIRDNPLGNAFESSMNLDPVTGDLYITGYDTRNDQPANQYVEFFGTIVSSAQLTVIINTL